MSERLVVRNFGPIKEADLVLKRYTLFIGSQASGKSTIAKLLAIFRDAEFVVQKDASKHFKNYGIDNYFLNGDTFFNYSNEGYVIEYKNKTWSFSKSQEFENDVLIEQERIMHIITTYVNSNEQHNKKNSEEKNELIKQLIDINWNSLFSILKKQVYIPAERILVTMISQTPFTLGFGNVSFPNCLKEFGTKFEFARRDKKELRIDFLNITYKIENGEDRIYFNENKSVLLSESASGFQVVVPMLLVFEHLKGGNNDFIVEEPEMNIFPTVQKDIINLLVTHSKEGDGNSSLVITTHSPYILTILNNLLFAFKAAEENPDKKNLVHQIVSKNKWINPEEFNAYYLSNGTAKQILDVETGLISDNELDNVSMDLSGERDALLEIYR